MTNDAASLSIDLFERCLATTEAGVNLFMLADEVATGFEGADEPSEFGNGLTVGQEMVSLKADLRRLEQGWKPDASDLASTILLETWGVYFHPDEALWRVVGNCVGGEQAGVSAMVDGAQRATLQVLAIDDDFTWVRDRRGFYRLGTGA